MSTTTERRTCPFSLELLEECSIRKVGKEMCPFTLEPCLQPTTSTIRWNYQKRYSEQLSHLPNVSYLWLVLGGMKREDNIFRSMVVQQRSNYSLFSKRNAGSIRAASTIMSLWAKNTCEYSLNLRFGKCSTAIKNQFNGVLYFS